MATTNQKPEGSAHAVRLITVPTNDPIRVAQILGSALKSLGYWDISLQVDLLRISVRHHEKERLPSHTYEYEYGIQMSWKPVGSQIELSIQVTERKQSWQINECHRRLEDIFNAIEETTESYQTGQKYKVRSTLHGDARFADIDEIAGANLTNSKENRNIYIGTVGNKPVAVPEHQSHRHTLVCGPTGSGKTWSVFIPNLIYRTNISAIVTEARSGSEEGHLFKYTSGHRLKQGHKVFHFDPQDLTSTRINPVEQATDAFSALHVAALIMENTSLRTHIGDQIWETSERLLLTALLLDACKRQQHLGNIRWLLRKGPLGMSDWLINSPSKLARLEYASFINNSLEGFRAGVVAGLMQRLSLWIIPEIVALTETTDFNITELSDSLFTFYLSTPSDKAQFQPLMALVFNYVLHLALNQKNRKHPLFLFLDEFVNYGRIPHMPKKLTMIRHSEVGAILGIQDYLQLDELYGDKQAKILFGQPAARIFFRPNDLRTAEEISKLLGRTTAEELSVNSRCDVTTRTFPRWLMTSEEVLGLEETQMIARLPGLRYPALLNRIPRESYVDKTYIEFPRIQEHKVTDSHFGLDEGSDKWIEEAIKQQKRWSGMTDREKHVVYKQEKGNNWQPATKKLLVHEHHDYSQRDDKQQPPSRRQFGNMPP